MRRLVPKSSAIASQSTCLPCLLSEQALEGRETTGCSAPPCTAQVHARPFDYLESNMVVSRAIPASLCWICFVSSWRQTLRNDPPRSCKTSRMPFLAFANTIGVNSGPLGRAPCLRPDNACTFGALHALRPKCSVNTQKD